MKQDFNKSAIVKSISLFLIAVLTTLNVAAQDANHSFSSKAIQSSIEEHVNFLCSPNLLGRSTITGHDKIAASYIDSLFSVFQLNTTNSSQDTSHKQAFGVVSSTPKTRTLSVLNTTFHYGNQFVNLGIEPQSGKEFEIVFGGFGEYETIDTLNLEGKALLVLTNSLRLAGMQIQEHAQSKGCSLIIAVNPVDPGQFESIAQQFYGNLYRTNISVAGVETESITRYFSRFGNPIPQIVISTEIAQKLLGEPPQQTLKRINQGESLNFIPSDIKVSFDYKTTNDTLFTSNVIGWIPAANSTQQSVVACAHFDHLAPDEQGWWYPGADDNASGTAILIEVARMLAKDMANGYQPRRNIVFAAFTAEEIGLLGSHHFVNNPLFPTDSTKLLINFDMVGRMGKQRSEGKNLYLVGNNLMNRFAPIFREINNDTLINIDTESLAGMSIYSLSDHHHFDKKGVPAYLLTTGLHNDYHKPSDTPDKLAYDNMVRIAKLAYKTLRHFADRPNPWEIK